REDRRCDQSTRRGFLGAPAAVRTISEAAAGPGKKGDPRTAARRFDRSSEAAEIDRAVRNGEGV
ncbi:uncharacterized protein METZ01_LOCUS264934, partial [marine metagenome]